MRKKNALKPQGITPEARNLAAEIVETLHKLIDLAVANVPSAQLVPGLNLAIASANSIASLTADTDPAGTAGVETSAEEGEADTGEGAGDSAEGGAPSADESTDATPATDQGATDS